MDSLTKKMYQYSRMHYNYPTHTNSSDSYSSKWYFLSYLSKRIYPSYCITCKWEYSKTTQTKDANDPVDLSTGDFTYSNTIMHLEWDSIDYDVNLSYKSQVEYNGVLGYNWDHNYNKRLVVNTGGSVTYIDGKLGKYTFFNQGLVISLSRV